MFSSLDSCYVSLEYERVYLPLYKVADTPFHIQGDVSVTYLRATR